MRVKRKSDVDARANEESKMARSDGALFAAAALLFERCCYVCGEKRRAVAQMPVIMRWLFRLFIAPMMFACRATMRQPRYARENGKEARNHIMKDDGGKPVILTVLPTRVVFVLPASENAYSESAL